MSDRRVRIKMLVGIWKEKGKSLGKLLFKMTEEGMDAGCAAFVSFSHQRLEEESLLRRRGRQHLAAAAFCRGHGCKCFLTILINESSR